MFSGSEFAPLPPSDEVRAIRELEGTRTPFSQALKARQDIAGLRTQEPAIPTGPAPRLEAIKPDKPSPVPASTR